MMFADQNVAAWREATAAKRLRHEIRANSVL